MKNQIIDEENIHCCNMCGEQHDWNSLIWLNSSVGVCEKCYNAMPEKIREKVAEEDYDNETRKWLDEHGVVY